MCMNNLMFSKMIWFVVILISRCYFLTRCLAWRGDTRRYDSTPLKPVHYTTPLTSQQLKTWVFRGSQLSYLQWQSLHKNTLFREKNIVINVCYIFQTKDSILKAPIFYSGSENVIRKALKIILSCRIQVGNHKQASFCAANPSLRGQSVQYNK